MALDNERDQPQTKETNYVHFDTWSRHKSLCIPSSQHSTPWWSVWNQKLVWLYYGKGACGGGGALLEQEEEQGGLRAQNRTEPSLQSCMAHLYLSPLLTCLPSHTNLHPFTFLSDFPFPEGRRGMSVGGLLSEISGFVIWFPFQVSSLFFYLVWSCCCFCPVIFLIMAHSPLR